MAKFNLCSDFIEEVQKETNVKPMNINLIVNLGSKH